MNRRSETKRDSALEAKEGWLGLMIGNSRLHWAWFIGETLCCAWDTEYLPSSAVEQLTQRFACGSSGDALPQTQKGISDRTHHITLINNQSCLN